LHICYRDAPEAPWTTGNVFDTLYDNNAGKWLTIQVTGAKGKAPDAEQAFGAPTVVVYSGQTHYCYRDLKGVVWDVIQHDDAWTRVQVTGAKGQIPNAPAAAGGPFVIVWKGAGFNQMHYCYRDAAGAVWDAQWTGNEWIATQVTGAGEKSPARPRPPTARSSSSRATRCTTAIATKRDTFRTPFGMAAPGSIKRSESSLTAKAEGPGDAAIQESPGAARGRPRQPRSIAVVAKVGYRIGEIGEGLVLIALAFGSGLARPRPRRLLGRQAALADAKLEQADSVGYRQAHAGQGGGGALLLSTAAPCANAACLRHGNDPENLSRF